jgi:2-polyprenyl-6-methoxyphenol hydroxylase-like FAD-dependent oxidoreductase
MLSETVLAEDALMKSVRRVDRFVAVARAVPAVAAWLDCADPTTDVFGMGALKNTLRRVVRQSRPVVLGLHQVGDAACTTNPTLGRGVSFAVMYAQALADTLDVHPDDPFAQAVAMDQFVIRQIEPWFRQNAQLDLARVQFMRSDLASEPSPPPPPAAKGTLRLDELLAAGQFDADLYRVQMRYLHMLADPQLLSDHCLIERVRRTSPPAEWKPPSEGPTRAELSRLLAV